MWDIEELIAELNSRIKEEEDGEYKDGLEDALQLICQKRN